MDIKELDKLKKEIDEEIDELWKLQTVINSLKTIFNYIEKGDPYPENKVSL